MMDLIHSRLEFLATNLGERADNGQPLSLVEMRQVAAYIESLLRTEASLSRGRPSLQLVKP